MRQIDHHCPPDDNDSDNNMIQQANQSGRDEEDDKVKEVESDEEVRDPNLASLMIDSLPDFAFYAKGKVEIQQIDFADAFEHHPIEPATFHDAYNHPDPSQCKKGHEAIKKEFCDMTHCGVWRKVKRSTIPHGR